MNKLKKTLTQVYTPGSPGVIGVPGEPPRGETKQGSFVTVVETRIVGGIYAPIYRGTSGNYSTDSYAGNFHVTGTYGGKPGDKDLTPVGSTYLGGGVVITSRYITFVVTTTPGSPGRPPIPAIPPTLSAFRTQFNLGWNSGAHSVGVITGDKAYEFSVPVNTVGIVTGLNDIDTSPAYQEIDYGFYLTQGKFVIVEGGQQTGSWMAYTTGDVFRVERTGTRISYVKNGVFLAASPTPSVGALLADSSFYSGGDAILDAAFKTGSAVLQGAHSSLQPLGSYGSDYGSSRSAVRLQELTGAASGREAGNVGAGSLQSLISRGTNKQYAASTAKLSALVSAGTGIIHIGARARMQPLVGRATNKAYASSTARLLPLRTEAHTSEFTPSYAISGAALVQMTSAAHGLTGEIGNAYVALGAMQGVAADRPYGFGNTNLSPVLSYGEEAIPFNAYALLTLGGKFSLVASGTRREPNSFHGTLTSGYQLSAYAGSTARMTMVKPTLQIEASFAVVGRAAMSMPMATLEASGMGGTVGRAGMTMGSPTLRAFAGAVVRATLHDGFVLNAKARQGGLGRAGDMTMPLFTLVATGLGGAVGKANLTMPMLRAAPSGKALLAMPGFELVAIGHAVVAVSYEAYAVTLNHDADQNEKRPGTMMVNAVTHYTNYPFNQILRFGNKYYGIGDTGIYALEGDTDAGNPISWALETTLSDMGTAQKKRVASASIGGRVTSLLNFTLIVGEAGTERYNYATPRSDAAQNYRQVFGKGVNARYVGFGIADEAGGRFEMDTLDIEHFPLNRSI